MSSKSIQLTHLNHFSIVFNQMSLKDLVLFMHVAKNEGLTREQLLTETGFDERSIQGALRKLTGSRLASNACRYELIKEAITGAGVGYFLTGKGKEFVSLLG